LAAAAPAVLRSAQQITGRRREAISYPTKQKMPLSPRDTKLVPSVPCGSPPRQPQRTGGE